MSRGTSNTTSLTKLGATFIVGDVTDKDSVARGIAGCDWVVHLAAVYSYWQPDPRVYETVNVYGTRIVMECALEAKVSKVVHVSTAAVWGNPVEVPFTEQTPVGPVRFTPYAESKYRAERIAWDLWTTQGLPLIVIYPGMVVGPRDPSPAGQYVVNLMHRRVPFALLGRSGFTMVHVADVAEAVTRSLEKEQNIGEKYLVGKYYLSWGEFSRLICELAAVPYAKIRAPDSLSEATATLLTWLARVTKRPPLLGLSKDAVRHVKHGFRFDGSKAMRELGVTYTPIRVALEQTVSSFR